MTPARPWDVPIHCYCTPAIGSDIVNVEVIQGDIFDRREDGIVPAAKNDKLVFKESRRVLGSCDRAPTLRLDSVSEKLNLRS